MPPYVVQVQSYDQQHAYLSPTVPTSMSEATTVHQLRDILQKIGVGENHLHKFMEQEIGIQDFLLLTREDLIELHLPIAARNRIIAFQQHFRESSLSDANGMGWDGESGLEDFNMDEVIRKVVRGDLNRHHVETTELLDYSKSQAWDASCQEKVGAERDLY